MKNKAIITVEQLRDTDIIIRKDDGYGLDNVVLNPDEAEVVVQKLLKLIDELRKPEWERAKPGSLVALGHPNNGNVARKSSDGNWYQLTTCVQVDEEDFIKGTWQFLYEAK